VAVTLEGASFGFTAKQIEETFLLCHSTTESRKTDIIPNKVANFVDLRCRTLFEIRSDCKSPDGRFRPPFSGGFLS